MTIPINRDADREPIEICAIEAKRTLAITLHRLGELVISIPSDKFVAIIETLFEDGEVGRKFNDLVVCINEAALKAKEN